MECSPPADKVFACTWKFIISVEPTTGSLGGGVHSRRAPENRVATSVARRDDGVEAFSSTELGGSPDVEADPKLIQCSAMALSHSMLVLLLLLALVSSFCMLQVCHGAGRPFPRTTNAFMPFQYSKFQKSFFVAWSESNVAAVDGGHTLQLSLDRKSGELVQCLSNAPQSMWSNAY